MKYSSSCLIVAALLALAHSEPTQEELAQCIKDSCEEKTKAAVSATTEQIKESYKYTKCQTGIKNPLDTDDSSASITHNEKCKSATTFAQLIECSEACLLQYTDGNPLKAVVECTNGCMSGSGNILTFSALIVLVLSLLQ